MNDNINIDMGNMTSKEIGNLMSPKWGSHH